MLADDARSAGPGVPGGRDLRRGAEVHRVEGVTSSRCEDRGVEVLTATLVSFAVIFVAELGDKSQLMALTFATRYPAVPVLIGITVATALVHGVSVLVGGLLGATIPTRPITLVAGLAFVAFGVWTLRGDRLSAEDERRAAQPARHVALTVGTVFFLAELGDKTMLATITLATREGLFGTWLGSTLGMVAADALAIGVGRLLGDRLPERAIRIGAATTFFVFGAVLLLEAARA
jgi:putative Ca2+/H+ antiporter (TMEM165/GDT1 family)